MSEKVTGKMPENKSIWVVQTSFVGDCLLSLPFLQRLLERFPDYQVLVWAQGAGADVFDLALERGLRAHCDRVKVVRYQKRGEHRGFLALYKLVRQLRGTGSPPDMVFCLQRSFRSGVLALMSGSSCRVGFSSGSASYFYNVHVQRDWDSQKSEVEKNLDLLRIVLKERSMRSEDAWDTRGAPALLSPLNNTSAASSGNTKGGDYVVLSLGSPWATKRWPVKNAAELCQKLTALGTEVVLLGDQESVPLGEELCRLVPSLLIKNACGKTNVKSWVDSIAGARALVSGDSAAVHVASDLNVPTIALFGPTVPDFGFAPWRQGSLVLGVKDLSCRPCDIHGPRVCPLGHHKCMVDLSGERVFRYLQRLIPELNA